MRTSVTVSAPAKVNLFLDVGDARPDGYHELLTVLQALEFGDRVTLSPAEGLTVECRPPLDCDEDANLAYRAAMALAAIVGQEPRFRIVVEKRVPAGAGLGGGSSDAAAVIHALACQWGIDPRGGQAARAAAVVGSDVPFFLQGGTQLRGGRGEALLERLPTPELEVTLVHPGVSLSTQGAYEALDTLSARERRDPRYLLEVLRSGPCPEAVAPLLFNGMTISSVALAPVIGDALESLRSMPGVFGAEMAGSGSAVFGVFESKAFAENAAEKALEVGWWAVATRASAGGVRVEEGQ